MNISQFKQGLKQLQTDMEQREADSKDEYADRFGNLLQQLLLSVKVSPGIPVSTTGSAAAQTGATTALGNLQ